MNFIENYGKLDKEELRDFHPWNIKVCKKPARVKQFPNCGGRGHWGSLESIFKVKKISEYRREKAKLKNVLHSEYMQRLNKSSK